jgi:hypothetical protein
LRQGIHATGPAARPFPRAHRRATARLRHLRPRLRRQGEPQETSVADPDSSCKNSKKNLDSYYFVTLFDFLSLKKDVNVTSKSKKQKKIE